MADLSEKKTEIESFIDSVASRSGNDDPAAIWPGILTCAFTSANTPSAVPLVYLHAIAPFSKDAPARRLVLRRIKEALIKGCLLFGIPRTLNAFYALVKVLPKDDGEESVDTEIVRKEIANPLDAKVVERGLSYFENIYRKDMPAILEPMDRLFPDLRVLTVHLEYGTYMSETKILSPIETSMTTIASLLPMDVPAQVKWHMRGLLRNGGTEEQIVEALKLAARATEISEVVLKGGIPEVQEVLTERLF